MYFYAVEATLSNPFDDPVGPAESGWAATPNLALCEIETAPTRSMVFLASDVGYRTRATDPGGVVAYPPSVVEAFKVDVEANLDPTKSAVAAAFGNLTLNNLDGSLDSIVSNWNSDGQPIRVLRGQKALDAARGVLLDPPYASLVQVFGGVMGPWFVTPTSVQTALRDASYYLERQVPRNLYDGTGGLDGEVGLAGRAKPLAYGGPTNAVIKNVTPVLVDASNLIYQVNDGPVLSIGPIYDGGYAGITASGDVADLYSGTTAAGHYRTCVAKGLFQLGSSPTFEATADLVASAATLSRTDQLARYLLATVMSAPLSSISSADGIALNSLGPDPAVVGRAMALGSALYVATDDAVDGVTLLSRVLEPSGALLVPGSDGLLRIYVPCAIPITATPLITLDDTKIITIDAQNLPSTVDPAPWRIRVAWDRNWTVLTSGLAGATPPSRVTWLSAPYRSAFAGASAVALLQVARPSDPPPFGQNSGVTDQGTNGADVTAVAHDLADLWGTKRRLYSITIPHTFSDNLTWGSVVKLVSDFDNLDAGKLGQIVGWSYASGDATATLKVLV